MTFCDGNMSRPTGYWSKVCQFEPHSGVARIIDGLRKAGLSE